MTIRHGILAVSLALLAIAGCSGGSGSNSTPTPTPTAATPAFNPAPGNYAAAQSVTLTDTTPGAAIYYTTNGSTPTTSSTLYSKAIAVSSTTTIEAIAVASGYNTSAVASGTFTITISQPAAATPTFSPTPGTYSTAQPVTLSDTTQGATIYYTTDGSTPTTSSTLYTGSIAYTADTTIQAIATATGYSQSAVASGTFRIAGPTVSVVLSTDDGANLMAAQPSVTFTATTTGTNKVIVDENQQYQTMEGFGAAFTDSAAYLLHQVAQPSALTTTMSELFTRNGDGIGLSFMRNPMGASDIARSVYSFDDMPVGQTDVSLANFSIAHDQTDILPIILQAKALNPQMKILASPWSPPGWMKDPSSMSPVSMLGGRLLMTTANETAFANYFVKYIKAYEAAGVPIDYISLQNEPLNVTTSYPSMGMDAPTQLTLLRDYILPALTANNLTTQVLVYDHNWDTPSYPETVLSDPTVQASNLVAGTAWHGYGGTPGAQQTIQNEFPTKGTWETEHSGGTWVTDQFSTDFVEITQVLRNSAKSFVKWSLALNQYLGPDLTQNAGLGGCNTCTPIVTVNSQTGAITKDIEYYTLGHYSKYVLPGAKRIYSSNANGIVSVAFQNPDGSKALVAFNGAGASTPFTVQWGTQSFTYTLPSMAAATFTWSGTQNSTPTLPATSQVQGSSYSSESGLETETTSDAGGGYDLGYINPGASAVYKNVDFGTGVTGVSVRTASGGNGGTVEFHLDSPTGTLIASATLPVTGGWQTWQTVTAPASGASGVHDLYIVFSGGGSTKSIANLNWFQFN
jgi:glucosylceramidase